MNHPRRFFMAGRALRRFLTALLLFAGVTLAVDSAYSQFVLASVPDLPAVFSGSVAWGDYDNDGQLDFRVAATITGGKRFSALAEQLGDCKFPVCRVFSMIC